MASDSTSARAAAPLLAARRRSRQVRVGAIAVGGDAPISVQSMCSTDTRQARATLDQICALAAAGCQIVRVAVPSAETLPALAEICRDSALPVVADIHFDYRLALGAVEQGIAGLRYNPGNIGSRSRVAELARAAADHQLPIRIGVNAGSLDRRLLSRYGGRTPEALVESALGHAALLEEVGFHDIKLSLKASDVSTTVAAYRLCAAACDYPLHLGVSEAGTRVTGAVKSALALGLLLADGIGDTLRVSLSADPVEEIWVARQLLRSLGLQEEGLELVSCPRCGRASVDVHGMAERIELRLRAVSVPLRVAVMGCEVNGPGEARGADLGIAGADGRWTLFVAGRQVRRLDADQAEEALVAEALRLAAVRERGSAG